MQVAGSSSWRFTGGDSTLLHTALYVRDRSGLVVQAAPDVPPALVDLVGEEHRTDPALAGRWLVWWRSLVALEAADQTEPDREDERRFHARAAVFDPPGFQSLADAPRFQALVKDSVDPASRWFSDRRAEPSPQFPWADVNAAVQQTVQTFSVTPGEVRGAVITLDVEGLWSYRPAPGVALCSTAVVDDSVAGPALLRTVLASGLA